MGLKVVVTGGGSGIGRAAALQFSKDGHDVFITGRSEPKLTETARIAKEAGGGKVHTGVGDVGVAADVKKNWSDALEVLGGEIDVVVLNAGTGWVAPIEESSEEDFDKMFNANIRGVFLWAKAIVPTLKKRGSGQIVIIGSISGDVPLCPGLTVYAASKFAVHGLAQALRIELQDTAIKVAIIVPGVVDTNLFDAQTQKGGQDGRELFGVEDSSLAPEDVALAITTIAYQSPRSDIERIKVMPKPAKRG